MGRKNYRRPMDCRAAYHASSCERGFIFYPRCLARGSRTDRVRPQQRRKKNSCLRLEKFAAMISIAVRAICFAAFFFNAITFAQSPFQFPTANHSLYEVGNELKFFAPTAPDK